MPSDDPSRQKRNKLNPWLNADRTEKNDEIDRHMSRHWRRPTLSAMPPQINAPKHKPKYAIEPNHADRVSFRHKSRCVDGRIKPITNCSIESAAKPIDIAANSCHWAFPWPQLRKADSYLLWRVAQVNPYESFGSRNQKFEKEKLSIRPQPITSFL